MQLQVCAGIPSHIIIIFFTFLNLQQSKSEVKFILV